MTETEAARRWVVPQIKAAIPGVFIEKIPGTSFKKGFPDYVVLGKGFGGLIEVKLWDNPTPTALQMFFLMLAENAGGFGMVVIIQQDRTILCKLRSRSKAAMRIVKALAATVELP